MMSAVLDRDASSRVWRNGRDQWIGEEDIDLSVEDGPECVVTYQYIDMPHHRGTFPERIIYMILHRLYQA